MIARNIQVVKEKIIKACNKANRVDNLPVLIAVSKTKPIEMLQEAYDLGTRYFGENKDTLPTYTIDLAKLDLTKLGDNAFDLSSNQLTYEILIKLKNRYPKEKK